MSDEAQTESAELVQSFTTGKAIPVALKSIEKELASLWRTVADNAQGGTGPVTRACLWNLIIRTPGGEAYLRAKQLVDAVSSSLPARVLVLSADTTAARAPAQAWIEANWHAGGGGRQIGSEEITLQAGGDAVDDLAQVVRALMVPDVPTAAVWHEVHPATHGQAGSALDDELLAGATRVLVAADGDEANLRAMASLLDPDGVDPFSRPRLHNRVDLMSLGWLRATAWRQLLASLFDAPTPPDEIRAVTEIKIVCAADRVDAALLCLGWITSRLNWKKGVRSPGAGRSFTFANGRGASIEEGGDGADVFREVELTTPAGSYSIARSGGSVIINTPQVARKQPRHVPAVEELWLDALGARGRDELFLDALRVAAKLV